MSRLVRALVLPVVLFGPTSLPAQEHRHVDTGERLGRVRFPVSCSPEAQTRFEHAVAYLHSFWYEKATEAFPAVLQADSSCAMGHWGVAMSLLHPLWTPPPPSDLARGLAAAEQGLGLAKTARERDYLTAIATYYRDYTTAGPLPRLEAYADAMGRVHERHPDDREAAIFYGLALIAVGQAHPTDTTFAHQRRAHAILEPIFRGNPEHPGLAHYVIHATDYPPLARLGLFAARRYAEIAPDVPHAQHMPSHIFTRAGMWQDVVGSNLRSAAAARRFEEAQSLAAMWDQTAHALDYLAYAYLQEGRDVEANQVSEEMARVTKVFPEHSLAADYALAAVPARYALERGRWDEAARLPLRPAPAWRAAEAVTHFARALGTARTGDTTTARAETDQLAAIEQALAAAGGPQTDWSRQVKIQRLAASAWLARASGRVEDAVRLAAEAAALEDVTAKHPVTPGAVLPARELQGDLLLELGRPMDALAAYRASLAGAPNRARTLYGAAQAAEQGGDGKAAREYYAQFLGLMERGDAKRPEMDAAKRFLATR
ncbi:MAG TPA: hypothetical protein VGA42_03420 [Gemmatimonadales bacterium]